MNLDAPTFAGQRGDYHWIFAPNQTPDLRPKIIEHFAGGYLAIAAFDSGPITCSTEERSDGWRNCGDTLLSPALSTSTQIPSDHYDEWYVFPAAPDAITPSHLYVQFVGFTLADPDLLRQTQDPTWCKSNYDWLRPLQASFWRDIDRFQPDAYLMSGDDTLLVTRDLTFFAHIGL